MTPFKWTRCVMPFSLLLFFSTPAWATDGHFLHGVGAVNSAMGGAGVAAPGDLLGSFYLNPAGLVSADGPRITLGFEMMKPRRTVSSEIGGFAGSTDSKSDFTPIPAFGWATRVTDRVSVGMGMLGIGGFGVDYPADPQNPVLGTRPQGFGQVTSNFQFMKISSAAAVQLSDALSVGVAFNFDWASLSVDPMPTAAPAFNQGTGSAYYSRATAADGAYGVGFQAGLLYAASDMLSLGLSYSSPQWFQDFEFNAVYENPELGNFQSAREIVFALDVPAMYTGGVAVTLDRLLWTADARYITYSSTAGFKESGFAPDFSVRGFGWEDIWAFGTGLQISAAQGIALRGGYHYSQNPIPDDQSAFNVPAPAVIQHHVTLGVGATLGQLTVDVGYYHAFRNEITGPFPTPMGTMSVSNEMQEDSFLVSFSFAPSGD